MGFSCRDAVLLFISIYMFIHLSYTLTDGHTLISLYISVSISTFACRLLLLSMPAHLEMDRAGFMCTFAFIAMHLYMGFYLHIDLQLHL